MRAVWKILKSKPELSHVFYLPCDSHGIQLLIEDLLQVRAADRPNMSPNDPRVVDFADRFCIIIDIADLLNFLEHTLLFMSSGSAALSTASANHSLVSLKPASWKAGPGRILSPLSLTVQGCITYPSQPGCTSRAKHVKVIRQRLQSPCAMEHS